MTRLREKLRPAQQPAEQPALVAAARERLTADERVVEARARHQQLATEMRWIQYAPPPRAELQARIERFVDDAAKKWLADNGARLVAALNPRRDPGSYVFDGTTTLTFGWYCAIAPEQACAALVSLLGRIDYEEGPPIADHAGVLQEIRRALVVAEGEVWVAEAERSEEWCRIHGREKARLLVEQPRADPNAPLFTMPVRRPVKSSYPITMRTNERGIPIAGSDRTIPDRGE